MNWYLSTYNGETLLIYDGMLVDTYSCREDALAAMERYNTSYEANERVGRYDKDEYRITDEGLNAKR